MSGFFGHAAQIVLLTLLAKGLGFLRDVLLVGKLDVSASTDMFYAALGIVECFVLFSGLNAMKSVATSTFTQERAEGRSSSPYLSSLVYALLFYGSLVSLPLLLFPGAVARAFLPGFDSAAGAEISTFLRIIALLVLFRGLSLVLGNLLAVRGKFIAQNLPFPLVNAVAVIVILISGRASVVRNLCLALPLAYLGSSMIQYILLAERECRLTLVSMATVREYVRRFAGIAYPLLFVTAALSLAGVVDKAVASFFEKGTITSFNLAYLICFLPVGLLLIPISSVLFPRFSRAYQRGDMVQLEEDYNRGQLLAVTIFVPTAVFMMCSSREIVAAAFLRRNFSLQNVDTIASFLFVYSFALALNSVYYLTSFLFQGAQKNMVIGKIGAVGYAVNIVCSVALALLFGPVGIAVGTVCAFLVFAVAANLSVHKHFGISLKRETVVLGGAVIALSVLSGSIVAWLGDVMVPSWVPAAWEHVCRLLARAAVFYGLFLAFGYLSIGRSVTTCLKELQLQENQRGRESS